MPWHCSGQEKKREAILVDDDRLTAQALDHLATVIGRGNEERRKIREQLEQTNKMLSEFFELLKGSPWLRHAP